MKPYVLFIGVVDDIGKNHSVRFKPGLNVVTGKSSTGKSALIEIYDYCFGSSDYTVPVGKITEVAKIFFVVLKRGGKYLVLARAPKSANVFIREVSEIPLIGDMPIFDSDWFSSNHFLHLSNFNKELGFYFNLNITDVGEDDEERFHRGRKKSSPSIRSFTSFNLQHQNLIANKHAVFYRFDQKEKREQVIEHMKVFLGFVDQKYFFKSQELKALEKQKRALELSIPKKTLTIERKRNELKRRLDEYKVLTGKDLVSENLDLLINNPTKWLEEIRGIQVYFDSGAEFNNEALTKLESEQKKAYSELRILEAEYRKLQSTIAATKSYFSAIDTIDYPGAIIERDTNCPFCYSSTDLLSNEANKLENAIDWLNRELSKSEPLNYSYEEKLKVIDGKVKEKRSYLRGKDREIASIKSRDNEIKNRSSILEQALKTKLFVELYLEDLVSQNGIDSSNGRLEELEKQIKDIKDQLATYPVSRKMQEAQKYLIKTMNEIGGELDFEESFTPVNLRFSFENFDLWYQKDNEKIYLRSMGSGANWLYCHLSLFLAFMKLFCKYSDSCVIPPILFIDQPTQVYFPNVLNDVSPKFDPKNSTTERRKEFIDDDIKSVNNFFGVILNFCKKTLEDTGVEPQIIITDHADNLALPDNNIFEDYVRARWRERGFIS